VMAGGVVVMIAGMVGDEPLFWVTITGCPRAR